MNHSELNFLDQQTHNAPFAVVERKLGPVIDFCVPVNPYFPTPQMLESYARNLEEILTYYPEDGSSLNEILGGTLGIPAENLALGNGSTELITVIDHLFIKESLLTSVPTFGRWTDQSAETGKRVVPFLRREDEKYQLSIDRLRKVVREEKVRCLAISNPNNPTGSISTPQELSRLLDLDLDLLIIDESFIEFATLDRRYSSLELALQNPNVIVLRSLGKSLGVHGVRLGYAVGAKETVQKIARFLPRWNINSMAVALLKDFPKHQESYEVSRARAIEDRVYLTGKLRRIPGITVYDSFANFLYVKVPEQVSGKAVRNQLISEHGCFVRECGNKVGSSSQFLRIAVNPRDSADKLCKALARVLI